MVSGNPAYWPLSESGVDLLFEWPRIRESSVSVLDDRVRFDNASIRYVPFPFLRFGFAQ